MRLIDELLKDDFFRGGYQPEAVAESAAPAAAPAGKKKTLAIAAGIGGLVLLLGGGAAYVFLLKPQSGAVSTGGAAGLQQTAAVVPPVPAAPAAVSDAVAAAPVSQATTDTSVTTDSPETALAAPEPDVTEEPPASPSASQPAPAVETEQFVLVFPKMTDKAAVDRVLAELNKRGIKASTAQSTEKGSVYKVIGVKPVPEAEANAVKLKASLFKIPAESRSNGDGTVSFDFGTYATPDEAKKAAAEVQKLGIDIRLGRLSTDVPAYVVTSAPVAQTKAEKAVGDLTVIGFEASLKKVP